MKTNGNYGEIKLYQVKQMKYKIQNSPKQYISADGSIKEFPGRYLYDCCGRAYYREGHNDLHVEYCYDCQQKLIGTRQTVIRYGDIPICGQSYNYRDNKREIGVSCYLPGMSTRSEFTKGRKKLKISAVIIGWGGDDEPLIDASTII